MVWSIRYAPGKPAKLQRFSGGRGKARAELCGRVTRLSGRLRRDGDHGTSLNTEIRRHGIFNNLPRPRVSVLILFRASVYSVQLVRHSLLDGVLKLFRLVEMR